MASRRSTSELRTPHLWRTRAPASQSTAELVARLALGHVAVAAHVPVLAAHADVHGVVVADVPDPAHGRGVDPRQTTLAKDVRAAVREAELQPAVVDDVQLLLLVVVVAPGRHARRQHDRVHAEGGNPQRAADLAEPRVAPEPVDAADG